MPVHQERGNVSKGTKYATQIFKIFRLLETTGQAGFVGASLFLHMKNIFDVQLSSEEADQKVARFISVIIMLLLWVGVIIGFVSLLKDAIHNSEAWNKKDFVCLSMFFVPIALIPIQLVRYIRKNPKQE